MFSFNNAVRAVFSIVSEGVMTNSDRETEDVPRAVLSLLQDRNAGAGTVGVAGGRESGQGEGGAQGVNKGEREAPLDLELDLKNLILGAVISLGGENAPSRGSEGCTYKYSSLLRLSLFLSAVPAHQLKALVTALLRINEEWPKTVLKAFSHHLSSSRATQDVTASASVTSSISFSAPEPLAVQIVLEVSGVGRR